MPVDQVTDDPLIGYGVDLSAALGAIVAAGIGRRETDLKRRQQRGGPGRGPWLTIIDKVPRGEFPVGVNRSFGFIELRRSFRFPTMFIAARPLDPDRDSDCAGKQRR